MPAKILLAGEGGQGVQTVAKIIAQAARKSGKFSSYIPSFGVEQRGGVSLAFVQISKNALAYPRFDQADTLIVFCQRALATIKPYLAENTLFIYDNSAISNKSLDKIKDQIKNYLAVPAQKVSQEKYSTKTLNMVMLGALAQTLKEIDTAEVESQILRELKAKIDQNPALKDFNLNAFREGISLAQNFDQQKEGLAGIEPKDVTQKFEDEKKSWLRLPEYCKGCALCIAKCPVGALKFSDDLGFLGNPMPIVDIAKCTGCGTCMHICPDAAIEVKKK